MKLGHISDLHIFALEQTTPRRFLNKRLVGGTNILFNRGKSHSPQVVQAALDMLDSFGVDHIAITGDLTNLALEEEFRAAANVIDGITDAESRVSVVPGNHDYYVPEIEQTGAFERHFERFQQSDLPSYQLETGYPFCKFFGEDVALIGLNTGIASPPMFAVGKVDEKELRSLEQLLDDPKVRDRYKIVMLHHPPIRTGIRFMDAIGLENTAALNATLADTRADVTLIAGHVHGVHHGRLGRHRVATALSTCSGFALDRRADAVTGFYLGPTGCAVIDTGADGIISAVPLDPADGPFSF